MANIEEGWLECGDGVKLHTKCWKIPDDQVKAVVYIHHGLGDHISRYEQLASKFNAARFDVYGFDARGHGKTLKESSEQAAGHMGKWESVKRDFEMFLQHFPTDMPKFIYGHSMGGLWMILYALSLGENNPFSGFIFSAPAIENGSPINVFKYWSGKVLLPFFPRLSIHVGLDRSNLTRIEERIEQYRNDSLTHPRISLTTGDALLTEGENLRRLEKPFIGTNVFMAHGTADILTSFEASKDFYERLAVPESCSKTSNWVEGGYHELHNDLCAEEVVESYVSWILKIIDKI